MARIMVLDGTRDEAYTRVLDGLVQAFRTKGHKAIREPMDGVPDQQYRAADGIVIGVAGGDAQAREHALTLVGPHVPALHEVASALVYLSEDPDTSLDQEVDGFLAACGWSPGHIWTWDGAELDHIEPPAGAPPPVQHAPTTDDPVGQA